MFYKYSCTEATTESLAETLWGLSHNVFAYFMLHGIATAGVFGEFGQKKRTIWLAFFVLISF